MRSAHTEKRYFPQQRLKERPGTATALHLTSLPSHLRALHGSVYRQLLRMVVRRGSPLLSGPRATGELALPASSSSSGPPTADDASQRATITTRLTAHAHA